ncbi:hypothetical protein [Burkholderia sp. A9]|uniref:hypothetical protein n=1 Tax=Burkholderia sp. A9 TaxID=1365108 RepID=UPI001269BFF0|nr:hypothetical protein [Burkholderia sp. A9]
MSSSSKFIVPLFFASISRLSFAGEAILFNDPSLIGFRNGRAISGFYDSGNEKFSCSFLFVENGDRPSSVSVEGYVDTPLLTFVLGELSPEFRNRNKAFDIKGILYRRDSEWVIQTEIGQAGCENATGVFAFGPKDFRSVTYHVIREFPAIGIRIVKGEAVFYDNRDGKFMARKSYLVEGDGVIVMKNQGDFSYIRYVGAGPKFKGRVTFGWVRTRDLVDPFPKK